jgi:hypothetical protein
MDVIELKVRLEIPATQWVDRSNPAYTHSAAPVRGSQPLLIRHLIHVINPADDAGIRTSR